MIYAGTDFMPAMLINTQLHRGEPDASGYLMGYGVRIPRPARVRECGFSTSGYDICPPHLHTTTSRRAGILRLSKVRFLRSPSERFGLHAQLAEHPEEALRPPYPHACRGPASRRQTVILDETRQSFLRPQGFSQPRKDLSDERTRHHEVPR